MRPAAQAIADQERQPALALGWSSTLRFFVKEGAIALLKLPIMKCINADQTQLNLSSEF